MNGTNFWIEPLLRKTPYDPVRDYAPITLLTNSPNILTVHPSVPVNSVKELIALAKAKPGELNYVGAGAGTSSHLAGELFKFMAGVNMVLIQTKSSGDAALTILRGEGQVTLLSSSSVAAFIKSGKLRALAVTSAKPSALAPELPTIAETLPGYEIGAQSVMFVPAGTPATIIRRLYQEIVRVVNQAEVKEKFLSVGSEVVGSSPEELTAAMKSDMVRMAAMYWSDTAT
jgi:tripartite-type tricarboxylate transporter receptor subunit TctC